MPFSNLKMKCLYQNRYVSLLYIYISAKIRYKNQDALEDVSFDN